MADGSLTFDTRIESGSFNKGMDDLNKSARSGLDRITSDASSKLGSLGTMAKVAIAGAVAALVVGIGGYIDDSIALASDLIEVQNVVSTTFQENTAAVNTWAKAAKEAYGMSELKAKKYTSTMGAMLKSMGLSGDKVLDMSEGVAGLAGDMASFYNLDHDTAFDKIRAGISGETEPLKQLGINMSVANLEAYALSQGIMTAYSEMEQAEQVQLRYNYLMQATADAQGDFAKTSDGLANKQRILNTSLEELSATVGGVFYNAKVNAVTFLNSMATAANDALTAIIGAFSKPTDELTPEIQNTIDKLNGIKTEVDDIKTNYAVTTINVKIKYEKSTELAADLDSLLTQTSLTKEQVSRMQEVSAELVKLYPGLRQYLGPGGIIHAESEVLDEIVGKYGPLSDDGKALLEELKAVEAGSTLTTEQVSQMQTISQQLVELYPELAQYMGVDGIIHVEAGEVSNLIKQYAELDRQRAFSTLVSDLQAQNEQAQMQLYILQQLYDTASQRYDQATTAAAGFESMLAQLYDTLGGAPYDVSTDRYLAAAQSYIDVFGTLAGIDTSKIQGFGELFDWEGNFKSAEEISSSTSAMQALYQLVLAMTQAATDQQNVLNESAAASKNNMDTASKALEEYRAVVSQTGAEYEAARLVFEKKWNITVEEFAAQQDAILGVGEAADNTAEKLGSMSQILSSMDGAISEAEAKSLSATSKQQAAIDKNTELADLTATIAANIEAASKAGTDAVKALTTAKETIATDAQAAVDHMEVLTTSLGLYVTAMKDNLVAIIADAETEAADAAEAFAQGQSDGYKRQPYLRDAVRAGMVQALATAQSYLNAFYNAGYGMAANMADGVRNGGGVLSSAVSAIIRSALSVARTGASTAYSGSISGSYATGLYRVPFNGFVMETHKNERLLTAQEAQYVPRDVTTIGQASPVIDIEALAAALKSDGGSISVTVLLDGETVADVMERRISEIQGRRFSLKG